MNLLEKIQTLCKEHGVKIAALERAVGISNGSICRWSTSSPSSENLAKVAKYFNVTTDYLLGLSDFPSPNDEEILSIQRARAKMPERDREIMMKMIKAGFDYAFSEGDDSNK